MKIKNLPKFLGIASMAFLIFSYYSCKDDSVSVSDIEGIATYDGANPADGAIVVLSTAPNASSILSRVVADVDGSYSFIGVEDGTYYISANYNTENQNNIKTTGFIFKTASDYEVKVSGSDITQNVELVSDVSEGNTIIDLHDGWEYDNTHSSIEFIYPYDEVNADAYGHFATAGFDTLYFDQANPENSYFSAWVDVTSVETGSPTPDGGHGRDGINGCIAGTFGVQFLVDGPEDTTALGDYTASAIVYPTGHAFFRSTSVTRFGNGYLAVGDFTFHGFTHSVNLYFHYIEGYEEETSEGGTERFASLSGSFKIKAQEDYDIQSHHVGDEIVTIITNIQVNKTFE